MTTDEAHTLLYLALSKLGSHGIIDWLVDVQGYRWAERKSDGRRWVLTADVHDDEVES